MECGVGKKSESAGKCDHRHKASFAVSWRLRPIFILFVLFFVCFSCVWPFLLPRTAQAAGKKQDGVKTGRGKSSVSYTVKNGTLILKGKGAVSPKIKVADKKKIKKIIVKKGVTSLPPWAFWGFKNVKEVEIAASVRRIGEGALPDSKSLKKVTMPGSFRYREDEGDYLSYSILPNEKVRIEMIYFNTPLSLDTCSYIKSGQLNVWKKDPKYRSIKGVVYSKDGKDLVRVPAFRKSLTVEEGCEVFCAQAVQYAKEYGVVDIDTEVELVCKGLKKIVLPRSVRAVDPSKYEAECYDTSKVKTIVVRAEHSLGGEGLARILHQFPAVEAKRFLGQLPDVVTGNGLFWDRRDGYLIYYSGRGDEVVVPDGISAIGVFAFAESGVKRVVVPDSVTEIGEGAFSQCRVLKEVRLPETLGKMGKSVFNGCSALTSVHFPKGLAEVPTSAFLYCESLQEVVLPDTVTEIGAYAFFSTKVPSSILSCRSIKKIKSYAFGSVEWSELTLPETVEIVEPFALAAGPGLRRVRICGSSTQISQNAFGSCLNDKINVLIEYRTGVEEWQTMLDASRAGSGKRSVVQLGWYGISGVDGWQIQVSRDKAFQKKLRTFEAKKQKTGMWVNNKNGAVRCARIRPYQMKEGARVYGKWSTVCL